METIDLLKALNTSIASLRQDLHEHHRLLMVLLNDRPEGEASQASHDGLQTGRRERLYRATIRQAIQTLEESRKSFKSKQLGTLRKELMNVLIDE